MEDFRTLLILMVVVWLMGKLFRTLKLPVIFGELVGGIIVGPLALNLVDPGSLTIKLLAELGVFFLMLHTGLEANPRELLNASKKSVFVAISGAVLPFIGGYFVALAFGQTNIEALFIAMCLSFSAIAISARLFKENKIQRTKAANIAFGAAVFDNIFTLLLFSIVLSFIETGEIAFIPILLLIFKVVLFFVVVIVGGLKLSKYLGKFLKNKGFTFTLIIALLFGLIAEWVGLHMVIGAFLAGLLIREEILDEKIFKKIEDRIYGLSYSFLGPIFFTSLAFHLDFSAVITRPWFLLSIIAVAVLGKVIGTGGTALLEKIKVKNALVIGFAMNSRGAMELVVASIGIQQAIISKDVFSILVIMAFTATMISIFAMKPIVKLAK